ncbi:MAG: phosphate/phosphite/phosphonate ABC transporter substrate-binding protein [Desulfobulbaceae bacterium]|uniref:Phosphate/phosphite/phosphonate ABC transporter substrate-binding protein n=1 Tax=Candidatus Desulfobia pelagia TaxID=2841692 RepID=A0A8J6NCY3_9BACT|nr:phosphate/phosphite/phosphonate ABC transporter substrate-binding protein [Candidatus Desulfobia pelagia]
MKLKTILSVCLLLLFTASIAYAGGLADGSRNNPLRVMLVPTDAGSSDITEDYKPVFDAITKNYGIHFKVMAGSSYGAVVEGMCNDQAEIAWFGPVTFGEAHEMCGAELLAVDVKKGKSVYYSGIYTRKDSGLSDIKDLKGHSMALGSTHSTSSFNFPVAMMIAAGLDPARDLSKIVIAGSHSNSIASMKEGRVDACAASFNSYEKAVKNNILDPKDFRVLAKSEPIPNPPMAMNTKLTPELKAKLKEAFNTIHTMVEPGKIRGYGGKKVDRYDADYPTEKMLSALKKLAAVTPKVKEAMVEKSGQQ